MCFLGVCDEEAIAFPKRWNTKKNFNRLQCGSMYQGFFEISLQLQEFFSLPFQLISSLCHQNKLQFVFRQELSLWSKKLFLSLTSVLFRWSRKASLKWTLYSQQWSFITGCTKTLRQHSMLLIWRISGFNAVC